MSTFPTQNDLHDLQGDVILGFPKRAEDFLFFNIVNVAEFKKGLETLIPIITTTAQIQQNRKDISDHKSSGKEGLLKCLGINIGFSKKGLAKLGATDDLGDKPFDNGMFSDAKALGDNGTTDAHGVFHPAWDDVFKSEIDGLISVAAESTETVEEGVNKVDNVLGSSFKILRNIKAEVRPGKEKGHEHFGFLDGISSPGIKALTGLLPGQIDVQPGILICGQAGDPVTTRPAWAKNGSFLAYRQLKQLVPEFNKFLADNPINVSGLTREEGSELTGARLFGRWKSGAPLDITPLKDDPALAADKHRNNNFDFSDTLQDQTRCPFAAHIRKTNPRADLLKLPGVPATALTNHVIMRKSIAVGPEVTPAEKLAQKTLHDRGLAFVCYQSNLANGFEFLQEAWADNVNFAPQKPVAPGLDPIIGQANGGPRQMAGLQINNQNADTTLPEEFVVSRGGAYFFVPSLTTLRTKLAA